MIPTRASSDAKPSRGRPPTYGVPHAARAVAKQVAEDPARVWRFSEVKAAVAQGRFRGTPGYLDVFTSRGLKYLVERGYLERSSDNGYRWVSPAWTNLVQIEDVIWSIRDTLAHLAEISKFRGRIDSSVHSMRLYLRQLKGFVPEAVDAIEFEVATHVRRAGRPIDLGNRRKVKEEDRDFKGRTGWIQVQTVTPTVKGRCATCGHSMKSHRQIDLGDGPEWICDPAKVFPLNTRCGCEFPRVDSVAVSRREKEGPSARRSTK